MIDATGPSGESLEDGIVDILRTRHYPHRVLKIHKILLESGWDVRIEDVGATAARLWQAKKISMESLLFTQDWTRYEPVAYFV